MKWILILICFFLPFSGNAQSFLTPADSLNKNRLIGVTTFSGATWIGSITALKYVWYDDFDKSNFHFFDDSKEWGQMDKMGHLFTAWQICGITSDGYQWAGMDHKKAAWLGAGFSIGYLTSLEILDAYNTKWGFSWSDMGFNLLGTATSFTQTYLWNEQYVRFKFSAQESRLASYRPEVLGNDFMSRTLKDYNGQTYWMSFNPFTWFENEWQIPDWICLSLGYGIQDQLIGNGGAYVLNDGSNQLVFTPYRQYYLSLDVDFQKIPTRSRLLKLIFRGLNTVKVPLPTLEYARGKIQFHPIYF